MKMNQNSDYRNGELIQIGLFLVALIGLIYEIISNKKDKNKERELTFIDNYVTMYT